MRSNAILPFARPSTRCVARTLAPISETPNDSSALRTDHREARRDGQRHGRRATDPVLFQNGTHTRDLLWYERALRPLFVAQLLGQTVYAGL